LLTFYANAKANGLHYSAMRALPFNLIKQTTLNKRQFLHVFSDARYITRSFVSRGALTRHKLVLLELYSFHVVVVQAVCKLTGRVDGWQPPRSSEYRPL